MNRSDHSFATGRQIAAARTILRLGQAKLAGAASISVPTPKRMKANPRSAVGLAKSISWDIPALEVAGAEFINGGEPGVKLRRKDPA